MPSQKAVTEKGLDTLLDQARRENPLRGPEPAVPPPNVPKSAAPPSSVPKSKQSRQSPVVEEFESTPGT
jgi:hypothetical protein